MHKTRTKIIALMLVILTVFPVFADQRNFRQSSEEVQVLFTLAKLTGTALPSMTYPISEEQLMSMLERIDTQSLSEETFRIYTKLKNTLNSPKTIFGTKNSGFNIDIPLTVLQVWNNDEAYNFKDKTPMFSPNIDVFLTDYFAAEIDFDFKADVNNYTDLKNGIKLISPLNYLKDKTYEYPTKAYGSVGTKNFNLTIGRSRVSAGNGITGNLELGENLLYQDYAKFSVLSGKLSYDFTVLVYDSPYEEQKAYRYNFTDPYKASFIHRFSTVFGKRVSVSMFEGIMSYSSNMLADVRALNPFMMIHNTFTYENENINNFFGVEVNAYLPYGLNLDVQGFIDQVRLKGESEDSGDNAFAVLADLNGTWTVGKGILSAYAEYAFVSKHTYLKELHPHHEVDDWTARAKYYQIDLVSANRHFYSHGEFNYIGYKHGSDVNVFGLGASYKLDGREYMFDFLYKVKGEFGIDTAHGETRAIQKLENHVPDEKTFSIALGSKGSIIKGIEYFVKVGYTKSVNYHHTSGLENSNPFWFAISFTVDPMNLK